MIVLSWPTQLPLAQRIVEALDITLGDWTLHRFPDSELKVTVHSDLKDKDVWILCSLDQPNDKILALVLLTETCRSLGARSVKLLAPYLAYMRQDKRFHSGEAISAPIFARLISTYFDCLLTVDPHCHRIARLSDIYSIPCSTLHAQMLFKQYIETHIKNPFILGPDAESEQWMKALSQSLDAPYIVLKKERLGDAQVVIDVPDLSQYRHLTPVFVDDIISTGKTLMVPMDQVLAQGFKEPYALAVHGVFAGDAYAALRERTPHIVTTNSVSHVSNGMDLALLLAEGMRDAH